MVQVPQSVKTVFDTFPLKQYPAIPNTTPAINDALENKRFYYQSTNQLKASKDNSDAMFILAVFNVTEVNGKLIPTDPFGLAYSFILAEKNGLRLPPSPSSNNSNNGSKSSHSIMTLAYNSAPDKTLPMIIEDDLDEKVREIRCFNELETLIAERLKDTPEQYLINHLIDTQFYDIWLLCIWFERDTIDLAQVFGLDRIDITKYDLFDTLPTWKHFKIRYPKLVVEVYENKLKEVSRILTLLDADDALGLVIVAKLYGFVIHADQFLKGTKLKEMTPESLIETAYEYLNTEYLNTE